MGANRGKKKHKGGDENYQGPFQDMKARNPKGGRQREKGEWHVLAAPLLGKGISGKQLMKLTFL